MRKDNYLLKSINNERRINDERRIDTGTMLALRGIVVLLIFSLVSLIIGLLQ